MGGQPIATVTRRATFAAAHRLHRDGPRQPVEPAGPCARRDHHVGCAPASAGGAHAGEAEGARDAARHPLDLLVHLRAEQTVGQGRARAVQVEAVPAADLHRQRVTRQLRGQDRHMLVHGRGEGLAGLPIPTHIAEKAPSPTQRQP